ncbi:hypothetical protein UlMin_031259 [Ulmus minor]
MATTLPAFSSSPPPSPPPPSLPNPNPDSPFISQSDDHPDNVDNEQNDESLTQSNSSPNPIINDDLHRGSLRSPPELLYLSFNQDQSFFAACTDTGIQVFNCDPFRELHRRDGGGIGLMEILFRCNIWAMVGGGREPQYPPNRVMFWDDSQNRFLGELSCRSVVLSVRLRRDLVFVVMEHKVSVYNFSDLRLMHQIETISNPKGLCVVSQLARSPVLVCLGLQKGQVRVEHYSSRRTKYIVAHDSRIACLALTSDGQVLATASTKGTLVRVFNTVDGTLLQEVRRGADRAEIYSLAFSSTTQWLAVSSDKGTVHVFSLKFNSGSTGNEKSQNASRSSLAAASVPSLSFIKGVLPKYFSSEWSVAQFRLVENSQYIVAFGHMKNTIIILGMDGSFYRCQFDPVNGGEMNQLEYHNFLKPEEAF